MVVFGLCSQTDFSLLHPEDCAPYMLPRPWESQLCGSETPFYLPEEFLRLLMPGPHHQIP